MEIWSVQAGQLNKFWFIDYLFVLIGVFGSILYFLAEFEARKCFLTRQANGLKTST